MNTRILLLYVVIVVAIGGCKKFVDIDPPPTLVDYELVFSDEKAAESAVNGLYFRLAQQNATLSNGGMTVYMGLSSDELYNTAAHPEYDAFRTNALTPNSATIIGTPFWTTPYNYIFQANAIMEGLQASSLPASVKAKLSGEMLFIRAFVYYQLASLYGDIPMILTTNFAENEFAPRTAAALVWAQIIKDLEAAVELLPGASPSATKLRANKQAAMALLARVYLYQKLWEKAVAAATAVIQDNTYALETLNGAFLAASKEAILQLSMPPTTTSVTWDATVFIPSSATARPTFSLTDTLVKSFKAGDQRLSAWTLRRTVSGTTYTYPNKYKTRTATAGAPKPEYIVVLRLAEQYLVRAESLAMLGSLENAIKDLDVIRIRAGLAKIGDANPSISKEDLLVQIAQERQIELFAEWGHRWLDLRRTGSINAVLSGIKTGWQSYKAFYPVPFTQIRDNPALTQNPGYSN